MTLAQTSALFLLSWFAMRSESREARAVLICLLAWLALIVGFRVGAWSARQDVADCAHSGGLWHEDRCCREVDGRLACGLP